MVTDALGFNIEIDSVYGYSKRANGVVTVIVGSVIAVNEEKRTVTLKVESKGCAIYGNPVKEEKGEFRNSNITANSIFKLENSNNNY